MRCHIFEGERGANSQHFAGPRAHFNVTNDIKLREASNELASVLQGDILDWKNNRTGLWLQKRALKRNIN